MNPSDITRRSLLYTHDFLLCRGETDDGCWYCVGRKGDPGVAVYCTADHKPHHPIACANRFVSSSIPQV